MTEQRDHQRDDPARGFIAVTQSIAEAAGAHGFRLKDVVDRLDERAFGLLILLLTIPCLVPGLPGAQVIAIPIFLLAAQLMLGRREPWLPSWALNLRIRKDWLDGVAGFADKRMRWTERLARPRLAFLASGLGERVAGLVMALAAVTIMLPLTNTIPSLSLTLMAVGLLQRDGVFVAAGMALALAWVTLLAAAIVGVVMGAGFFFDFAQQHLPWLVEFLNGASR